MNYTLVRTAVYGCGNDDTSDFVAGFPVFVDVDLIIRVLFCLVLCVCRLPPAVVCLRCTHVGDVKSECDPTCGTRHLQDDDADA